MANSYFNIIAVFLDDRRLQLPFLHLLKRRIQTLPHVLIRRILVAI